MVETVRSFVEMPMEMINWTKTWLENQQFCLDIAANSFNRKLLISQTPSQPFFLTEYIVGIFSPLTM